ncbi:hypothetical protein Airi02_030130 [Actinoallomurus iriomotensis]|uniref:Uncharacterized protein n=1 Tax=Actinoallomurus iriomotensis TaxID=478107 RepID=A0A9W6S0A7_9ACTN|nr:hypothetical protein Airi02_030130 [Actinoallomurus iriomotensis]
MRVRADTRFPHPCQQFREGRIAGQVGADDQRVDEEPDQIVERLVQPARHRGAGRHIRARAQPVQQHRQRGLHHHEHRHALGPRHGAQPGMDLRGKVQHDPVAPVRGGRRPRPVVRQCEFLRRSRQRLAPVRDLPRQQAARIVRRAQQLALPQCVVRVLHRQRRPLRRPARAPRRVGGGQVTRQRAGRPGVTGDVMRHHQ